MSGSKLIIPFLKLTQLKAKGKGISKGISVPNPLASHLIHQDLVWLSAPQATATILIKRIPIESGVALIAN